MGLLLYRIGHSFYRGPLKIRLLAQYGVAVSSAMLINELC
jgi:hypothetical protein